MNKPLTAKLEVRIDLSNGVWISMDKHTLNGNPITSANFNTDDLIDENVMRECLDKLEEAII